MRLFFQSLELSLFARRGLTPRLTQGANCTIENGASVRRLRVL